MKLETRSHPLPSPGVNPLDGLREMTHPQWAFREFRITSEMSIKTKCLELKLQSSRLSNGLFLLSSSSRTWEIDTALALYVLSALFLFQFEPQSECVLNGFVNHPFLCTPKSRLPYARRRSDHASALAFWQGLLLSHASPRNWKRSATTLQLICGENSAPPEG